jgi:drug/metabolite transporter (DMT)-like permease
MGDAMALACALAWAVAVILFQRIRDVDADGVNLFKNVFATALLLGTLAATGGWFDTARSGRDWLLLSASGILGLAVADTLFLAGLRRLDASVAAICECAYAPTVVLLGALLLGERLGVGIAIGGPLIVLGLFLVGYQRAKGPVVIDRRGVVLAMAGVIGTATGVVVAKPALGRSSLIEATAVRLVAGTLALLAFQLVTGRARKALSLFRPQPVWKLLVPATFLGTYVAMILWLGGMKYGTASRAALLNQSSAIMVLGLSSLLGEKVPRRRWIGAFFAVAGVVTIVGD